MNGFGSCRIALAACLLIAGSGAHASGAGLVLRVDFLEPDAAPVRSIEPCRDPASGERPVACFSLANGRRVGVVRCDAAGVVKQQAGFCLLPMDKVASGSPAAPTPMTTTPKAKDIIPHGRVARGTRDVARAWFSSPTRRYRHGVLGDDTEAGALIVMDAAGNAHRLGLDTGSVFEDLEPRIGDLDGDGADEILVVRSFQASGAAIAIVELDASGLRIAAQTKAIGRPNRWLNPTDFADLDGDGHLEIAYVETPHIGGTLKVWRYDGYGLRPVASLSGFSNHAIGSTVLAMHGVVDANGDGRDDLVVPSKDRRKLRFIAMENGNLIEAAQVSLPAAVVTEIVELAGDRNSDAVVFGLADGRLAIVSGWD